MLPDGGQRCIFIDFPSTKKNKQVRKRAIQEEGSIRGEKERRKEKERKGEKRREKKKKGEKRREKERRENERGERRREENIIINN